LDKKPGRTVPAGIDHFRLLEWILLLMKSLSGANIIPVDPKKNEDVEIEAAE